MLTKPKSIKAGRNGSLSNNGEPLLPVVENIPATFEQLAAEVTEDCKMVSITDIIAAHPSYVKIIGMGEKIIPFLIKMLDVKPVFWFKALESITGTNPVKKEHKGNIAQMVTDWKNWALSHNYA